MDMPSGRCIPGKPFIVTIFGASGAGKSHLAKATVAEFGEDVAARIPADSVFVPRARGESLDAFHGKPLAWDWNLVRTKLGLPIGTLSSTPDADFDAFTRFSDTGGLAFRIAPVMIADAMSPYPEADLAVFLDVPEEARRKRVRQRDRAWGTRVQDRWSHLEVTWRSVGRPRGDLVLDGLTGITVNAATLAARIGEERGIRRDRQ